MTIITKQVNTKGKWKTAEEVFGISMVDNAWYTIQVLGTAKFSKGATTPTVDGYTISFSNPFTYNKVPGENMYIYTDNKSGAIVTIEG